jgi:hypothetical protein
MVTDLKLFKEAFKTELLRSIQNKYGRIPSALFLADEFNRRAQGSEAILREALRKSLLGESIPTLDKIRVLKGWLNINLDDLLT